MKLQVELVRTVLLKSIVEIDVTKKEIRELYDLDRDDSVEDYFEDYVNEHRLDEVKDDAIDATSTITCDTDYQVDIYFDDDDWEVDKLNER